MQLYNYKTNYIILSLQRRRVQRDVPRLVPPPAARPRRPPEADGEYAPAIRTPKNRVIKAPPRVECRVSRGDAARRTRVWGTRGERAVWGAGRRLGLEDAGGVHALPACRPCPPPPPTQPPCHTPFAAAPSQSESVRVSPNSWFTHQSMQCFIKSNHGNTKPCFFNKIFLNSIDFFC